MTTHLQLILLTTDLHCSLQRLDSPLYGSFSDLNRRRRRRGPVAAKPRCCQDISDGALQWWWQGRKFFRKDSPSYLPVPHCLNLLPPGTSRPSFAQAVASGHSRNGPKFWDLLYPRPFFKQLPPGIQDFFDFSMLVFSPSHLFFRP